MKGLAAPAGAEQLPRSPGGAVEDEPAFERRGIDYIPYAERRGRPIDLALMWAGALFNVEYVVYGALVMSFGLRFWQAALVIVIGNLSYLITGLGSLQGPRAGTAAFTINRAPFGPNGAKLIAAFNWMTQVGYEVEGLALAVVLSAGGYGWPMNANDFSRYLPPDASPRRIVAAVAVGGYVPSTLLSLLGAALFTVPGVAGGVGATAVSGLPQAFASWFVWPYLVFVIVQLFAINSIDLYSSGLTLQAIFPMIKRWQCVIVDTTVAGTLTAVAVFSTGFNTFITDFLLFMLIWIAPWVSIYLTDYFMRRGRYDSRALLDTGPGIYFRQGGVNVRGIAAMVIGMVAAAAWLNADPAWTSPLSSHTGGADLSVFMGALFGGVTYWLLNRRPVAVEVTETDPLAEVAAATGVA